MVLDINAEPPTAKLKIDGEVVSFRHSQMIEFPFFVCKSDYASNSRWLFESAVLEVSLEASPAGHESCWFNGVAKLQIDGVMTGADIEGLCSCED